MAKAVLILYLLIFASIMYVFVKNNQRERQSWVDIPPVPGEPDPYDIKPLINNAWVLFDLLKWPMTKKSQVEAKHRLKSELESEDADGALLDVLYEQYMEYGKPALLCAYPDNDPEALVWQAQCICRMYKIKDQWEPVMTEIHLMLSDFSRFIARQGLVLLQLDIGGEDEIRLPVKPDMVDEVVKLGHIFAWKIKPEPLTSDLLVRKP